MRLRGGLAGSAWQSVDAGVCRQAQNALDGAVQHCGIPAGEVCAGGAHMGMNKVSPTNTSAAHQIGHVGRGVARRQQGCRPPSCPRGRLAIFEQVVKLAAIRQKAAFKVERGAEDFLHLAECGADRNLATQMVANIASRRRCGRRGRVSPKSIAPAQALGTHVLDRCGRGYWRW